MTIKHMNKNISAEKAQVVTNITGSPNGLLVTKTNLHDETNVSDAIDLTGTKLHLMILNSNNDLDLLADCDTDNKLEALNNYFEGEYQISFDSLAQLNDYIQSKMFLVEDSTSKEEDNIYNEYIWINGDFELIGTTRIDLTNYIQKSNGTNLLLTDGTNIAQSTFAQATALTSKENTSNKSSSITTDTGSTSKYPTVKAVEDYAEPKKEAGTFTELIALINNTPTGATITLDKDYINSEGLTGNIILPNEIHIDGNGHILDFNYANYYFQFIGEKSSIENWIVEHFQYTTFAITFNNIIIDNCIFRNSNSNLQSTNSLIGTSNATNFLMVNCQFYNIQASSLILITLHGSKQYIKNCIFYNNNCHNAILSNGGNKLVNNTVSCVFKNNRVYDGVIKHNATDNINTIVDCIFNNNTALSGNGSAINCKQNTVLMNNKFITSNDTVYPTTLINKNYLTEHQDISGKEDTSNKVTAMSSSSTDTQYPSAKAVYDALPKTTKTLTVTYTNGTTEDIEFYIR